MACARHAKGANRKKLVAIVSRGEGVYKRTAVANVTCFGEASPPSAAGGGSSKIEASEKPQGFLGMGRKVCFTAFCSPNARRAGDAKPQKVGSDSEPGIPI